jgi:hypothetical protein
MVLGVVGVGVVRTGKRKEKLDGKEAEREGREKDGAVTSHTSMHIRMAATGRDRFIRRKPLSHYPVVHPVYTPTNNNNPLLPPNVLPTPHTPTSQHPIPS